MTGTTGDEVALRFRKKPVVIEAMLCTYRTRYKVAEWCGGEAQDAAPSGTVYAPGLVKITTLEGDMWASEGDWIIRGVQGEHYPCKPDIFDATYEPASKSLVALDEDGLDAW